MSRPGTREETWSSLFRGQNPRTHSIPLDKSPSVYRLVCSGPITAHSERALGELPTLKPEETSFGIPFLRPHFNLPGSRFWEARRYENGAEKLKPCPICAGRRYWFSGLEWKCVGCFPKDLEGQVWLELNSSVDRVAAKRDRE